MKYLYARVSTTEQNTNRQLEAFKGQELIVVEDYGTGKDINKNLRILINTLTTEDTIYILELSRLGRNTLNNLKLVEEIKQKGASLFIKKENIEIRKGVISTTSTILIAVLSALAEVERNEIVSRVREGMKTTAAKENIAKRPASNRKKELLQCTKFKWWLSHRTIAQNAERWNMSKASVSVYKKAILAS